MVGDVRPSRRSPANTAGADAPCRSACSTTTVPPGRSSRAAHALDDRAIASSPSAPAHSASGRVVRRATSGSTDHGVRRGMYGGLRDDDVDGAVELGEGVGHVARAAGRRREPAQLRAAQA